MKLREGIWGDNDNDRNRLVGDVVSVCDGGMKMIDRNRRFRLIVAIGLAGLVAAREVIFLLEHPFRSGPAVEIVVLAAAVVLLGLERLKDPQ